MDRNEVDFITPLVNLIEAKDGYGTDKNNWQKLALALYALLKNNILIKKPKLIQVSADGILQVYGGSKIERLPDGRIRATMGGRIGNFPLNSTAAMLHQSAMNSIKREYAEEILEFAIAKAEAHGINHQRYLHLCMDWTLANMPLKWWSRKSSSTVEINTLMKYMWDNNILNREVFGAGIRLRGRDVSIAVYNAAMLQFDELKARFAEAPNLAPLLVDDLWTSNSLVDPLTKHAKVTIKSGLNAVQELREAYINEGGSPKGWRWLSHQGWTTVNFLQQTDCRMARQIIEVMAAAQVGRIPRIPRHALLASSTTLPLPVFAGMAKCLTDAYSKRQVKARDLADQIPLVMDYLRSTKVKDTSILKGATWKSLMRRQVEWHLMFLRKQREKLRASAVQYFWKPLVQEVSLGVLTATSLNDSEALWEEGTEMSHCVGGYSPQCYNNTSRIYSIRNAAGARLATQEVRMVNGRWKTTQLYGYGDKSIHDKAILKLASQVASRCNRAEPLKQSDNQVIKPMSAPAVTKAPAEFEREAMNDALVARFANDEDDDIPF